MIYSYENFECYNVCTDSCPYIDNCPMEKGIDEASFPKNRQPARFNHKHQAREKKKNLETLFLLCNTLDQVSVQEAPDAVKKAVRYLKLCKSYKKLHEQEAKKLQLAEEILTNSFAYMAVYHKYKELLKSLKTMCYTIDKVPVEEAVFNVTRALIYLQCCKQKKNFFHQNAQVIYRAEKALKSSKSYELVYCGSFSLK